MVRKKILLVYTNVRLRNQKPRPPVGLMYLAAALREKYEPVILDLRTTPDYLSVLKQVLPSTLLIGISTIIGQQLNFSLEAAKFLKKLAPDIPIVFGGTFPSMAPHTVLKESCVDYVSISDGEDTLTALADALTQGLPVSDIPNLAYRENGKIVLTRKCTLRSLDTPVMPAWDLVRPEDYREINVLSSKGCSSGCSFCYNRVFNQSTLRLRSVENTWKEIEYLIRNHNIRHIAFVDDNFFGNIPHAVALMKQFVAAGTPVTWETTCRADDLSGFDDEMLQLIHDSGCVELFVGFESASEEVLKNTNKRISVSQMEQCMAKARQYHFQLRALFVIGLAGESKKELIQTLKTVDYLRKHYNECVKIPVFGIYTPYPTLPPDPALVNGRYTEPQTMEEWSVYHHDRANHQWLNKRQRAYLENVIWVYRYYSKRSKFTKNGRIIDHLLYYDACLRWKLKWFSAALEWEYIRLQEQKKYTSTLSDVKKDYETVLRKELTGK